MKRKYLVVAFLLLVGVVSAQAQRQGGQRGQRPDPKEQAKKTADTWQEEFGLSDDQRTKVYDLLIKSGEDRQKKMADLRASGDREGMRDAMVALQEETDKGLKAIFTETQWPMYVKWKEKNPPARRGRGGGN